LHHFLGQIFPEAYQQEFLWFFSRLDCSCQSGKI
jgi:hypothetical protein